MHVSVTAAIAVLVVDMRLSYQTPSKASVEKTVQYQQNGLDQKSNRESVKPLPNSDNN